MCAVAGGGAAASAPPPAHYPRPPRAPRREGVAMAAPQAAHWARLWGGPPLLLLPGALHLHLHCKRGRHGRSCGAACCQTCCSGWEAPAAGGAVLGCGSESGGAGWRVLVTLQWSQMSRQQSAAPMHLPHPADDG